VNELQLHARLGDLADDLAPGDDPYALVAGARALHRRRRRARIATAGAVTAVALLAVGVPTVVTTLPAPGEGAAPGSPTRVGPDTQQQLEQEASRRLDRAVDQGLAALAGRPDIVLRAPSGGLGCADLGTELAGPFGPTLTPQRTDVTAGTGLCVWEAREFGARLSVRLDRDADPRQVHDAMSEAVTERRYDPPADGATQVSAGCYSVPVDVEGVLSSLMACDLSGGTQLVFGVGDAAGGGVWVLEADLPADSDLGAPGALQLLVTAADATW
jgi:hypothetical protein